MTKPNVNTASTVKPLTPGGVVMKAWGAASPDLKVMLDQTGKAYNPVKVNTWGLATNQDSGEQFPGRNLRGMVEAFRKDAALTAAASAFLAGVQRVGAHTPSVFDSLGDGRPYFRGLAAALAAAATLGPLLDAEAAAKVAAEKAAKVRAALKAMGMSDADIDALTA